MGDRARLAPVDLATIVLIATVMFLLASPDAHCMCLGKAGYAVSRRRVGFRITRDVLRFAEADDVEVTYTRIVSDGVYQLYARTEVTFAFLDREGEELARIAGQIDEPEQRVAGKWIPDAPIDLSDDSTRDRNARLGYAAVDWFHAFKDQRDVVPYR